MSPYHLFASSDELTLRLYLHRLLTISPIFLYSNCFPDSRFTILHYFFFYLKSSSTSIHLLLYSKCVNRSHNIFPKILDLCTIYLHSYFVFCACCLWYPLLFPLLSAVDSYSCHYLSNHRNMCFKPPLFPHWASSILCVIKCSHFYFVGMCCHFSVDCLVRWTFAVIEKEALEGGESGREGKEDKWGGNCSSGGRDGEWHYLEKFVR